MPTLQSRAFEWPTFLLLLLCYGCWGWVTIYADVLGWLTTLLILVPAITLHSSLQHETMHVIEPRWKVYGLLSVFPALGLFVPYIQFRHTHMEHHNDEIITDPLSDPETAYLVKETWRNLPPLMQIVLMFNNTLLGRMIFGPLLSQIVAIKEDYQAIKQGNQQVIIAWLAHIPAVVIVLAWVYWLGTIPFWLYLLACYLGLSVLKIRTYLEHRSHEVSGHRTVIITDKGPLALLFLNNNYHAIHHLHPDVAWYNLPDLYKSNAAHFLANNGHYTYTNYWQVIKQHFLTPKEPVEHQLWSLENRNES